MRSTHTYAVLEISKSAWDEIKRALEAAEGSEARFRIHEDGTAIDGHGLAFVARPHSLQSRWDDENASRPAKGDELVVIDPPEETGPKLAAKCDEPPLLTELEASALHYAEENGSEPLSDSLRKLRELLGLRDWVDAGAKEEERP